ncbi:hypothetical protein KIW84_056147 [Lathyrus oleraceus]|uniref:Uncharacterized protein n=1 Tax=Pisum sativum TaxID=3888 RepID=A0A9D4WXD8_PEA|nr:hypothetical protein KIW84_056147 [Pisum sativum]
MWPKVDMEEMLPSSYKKGPGRLKKLRRRKPDEEPIKRKPEKTTTRQGPTHTATQEQTQPTEAETATQKQPQPNETQIDVDPEFEMLAANLAATFKATQTQSNLVVNGLVASAPSHSAPVTST